MDDQPATKKDLAEIRKDLADAKQELLERMQKQEQRLMERNQEMIRDSQTEILRGFEVYAKTSEARLRRLEGGLLTSQVDDAAMNERLTGLESRMLDVEKKLMSRPPAA